MPVRGPLTLSFQGGLADTGARELTQSASSNSGRGTDRMRAKKGDTIVIRSNRVGGPERVGTIVAVEGGNGAPPYRVRWQGSDHIHFVYPGSDAEVTPKGQ